MLVIVHILGREGCALWGEGSRVVLWLKHWLIMLKTWFQFPTWAWYGWNIADRNFWGWLIKKVRWWPLYGLSVLVWWCTPIVAIAYWLPPSNLLSFYGYCEYWYDAAGKHSVCVIPMVQHRDQSYHTAQQILVQSSPYTIVQCLCFHSSSNYVYF